MLRATLLVLCLLFPVRPFAATLRPLVSLSRPVVLLSDLWDDAGAQAPRALGSAPRPGERLVVAAPQLAAIARQFGVDWRPGSPADQVVLERPGTAFPRAVALDAVRAALLEAGLPDDAQVDLAGWSPPMVGRGDAPQARVTQLDWQPGRERFSAELALGGDGDTEARARIDGRVTVLEQVVVPRRRVLPGTVLAASDLVTVRLRAAGLPDDVARTPAQAEGLAPRHTLQPEQPVLLSDLGPPLLVQKGDHVTLLLTGGGLSVVASGVALEAGAAGARVQALNPVSHAVVEGVVAAADTLRVDPQSQPLRVAGTPAGPVR